MPSHRHCRHPVLRSGSLPSSLLQSSAAIYATTPSRGEERPVSSSHPWGRAEPLLALAFSRCLTPAALPPSSTLHCSSLSSRLLELREILPRGMAASRAWLLARATAAAVLGFVLLVMSAEAASGDVEMVFLKSAVAKGAGASVRALQCTALHCSFISVSISLMAYGWHGQINVAHDSSLVLLSHNIVVFSWIFFLFTSLTDSCCSVLGRQRTGLPLLSRLWFWRR